MYEAAPNTRNNLQMDNMVGALCSTLIYEGVGDPANLDMRLTAQTMILDNAFNCLTTKSINHTGRAIDEDYPRPALRTQKRFRPCVRKNIESKEKSKP